MKKHTLISRNIDLSALKGSQRDEFIEAIYTCHNEVFAGVSRESFVKYVIDSAADKTTLQVFENGDKEIVGYVAFHLFKRQFRGRPSWIARAEAGLKRDYRGVSAPIAFLRNAVTKELLKRPTQTLYYLGSLVHPSSYMAFAGRASEYWPHPTKEVPEDMLQFMCELASEFGLEVEDENDPLVRHVGWATRDSEVEREYWQRTDNPLAKYYVEKNPRYTEGYGLVTLVPLDLGTLMTGLLRNLKKVLQRRSGRVKGFVHRLTSGRPMELEEAATLLAESPALEGLSTKEILLLAKNAREVLVPARQWLFRQGDRGDAMYIVTKGAAYVILNNDKDEKVLDQLSVGNVFGGMALITGSPRMAGVRAATELHLLRLERSDLQKLTDENPKTETLLWSKVSKHRFNNFLPELSSHKDSSREERMAWYDKGFEWSYAKRETQQLPKTGYIFLYDGILELEDDAHQSALTAPALVKLGENTNVNGADGCRCWVLPAHSAM